MSPHAALAARCVEVALLFRDARDAQAHAALGPVLAGIERALQEGVLDPSATAPILGEMLAAIERQDLLLVADVLEHVLAPLLTPA